MLESIFAVDFVVLNVIFGSREISNHEIEKYETCGEQGKRIAIV